MSGSALAFALVGRHWLRTVRVAMRPDDYALFTAGPDDALELAATTREGFESYRTWMPAGWQPPDHRLEILSIRARLGRRDTWCLLARVRATAVAPQLAVEPRRGGSAAERAPWQDSTAEAKRLPRLGATAEALRARRPDAAGEAGTPAGHVALLPGTLREPPRRVVPGLAHLWMLFVRPAHWGTGLAGRLHDLALDEARARGFDRIQLHTPERQARARAFYERRGWQREGPAFEDPMLALRIVRYRRPLDP